MNFCLEFWSITNINVNILTSCLNVEWENVWVLKELCMVEKLLIMYCNQDCLATD